MLAFTDQCVNRYLEVANIPITGLRKAPTPGIDDANFKQEDFQTAGTLATSAASVLMKILYLARWCRPDILHSVCMLAREVTKWNKVCDRRLHRLVSYLHQHRGYSLEGFIGDDPRHLQLVQYTDASFSDCSQTSRSTTGGYLALVGPRSFFPVNCLCKKQTCVSHSSTESEIVALDTCIRTESLSMLCIWDDICETLHPSIKRPLRSAKATAGDESRKTSVLTLWDQVLHVPTEAPKVDDRDLRHRTRLIIAEDNEAVIKILLKGRTSALRHLPRTHKINLDWLVEVIRSEQIRIRYCRTTAQLADMMTKHFTKPEAWAELLFICQVHMSSEPIPDRDPNGGTGKSAAKRKKSPKSKVKRPVPGKEEAVASAPPAEREKSPPKTPARNSGGSTSAPRAGKALWCLTQSTLLTLSASLPLSSGGNVGKERRAEGPPPRAPQVAKLAYTTFARRDPDGHRRAFLQHDRPPAMAPHAVQRPEQQ